MIRRKCIALNAIIRKEERFQINNLSFNPKKTKKKREKIKPKDENNKE